MGKGSNTVGFWYEMAVHMGFCRGPVDEIVEIKVGDKTAYSTPITASGVVTINQDYLFGGPEKEGGIQGGFTTYMGEATQGVNVANGALMGGLVPAFRGVLTAFYKGRISANNPYPKPWAIRVRRTENGWDNDILWYPDKATIWMGNGTIKAMNPAHIIYEALTNRDWGRGLETAQLDDAAFTNAANILCAEGFGLCFRYNRQDDVDVFIRTVCDHIWARVGVNRATGLFELKLIRDDYNENDLPIFDYESGLLSIEADESTASIFLVNEVIVTGKNPINNQDIQTRAHNMAVYQATGELISTKLEMFGIPTLDLCSRVAQRELNARSGGFKKFKVRMDRRAWKIQPGGVFRIVAPEQGIITPLVLRAGQIVEGQLTDAMFTIDAAEDVFGLPSTGVSSGQSSAWVAPSETPVAATYRLVVEASYRDLSRVLTPAELAALPNTAGAITIMAVQPLPTAINYLVRTAATGEAFENRSEGDWTPSALLGAGVNEYATAWSFTNNDNVDLVVTGGAALIGDEIVRVDSINLIALTMVVSRGVGDSIPQAHLTGDRIWFFDSFLGTDDREYSDGEVVSVKLLTRTFSSILAEGLAPIDTVTMDSRQERPYPPGDFRINAGRYAETVSTLGDIVFTWTHRDRVAQDDQLVPHASAGVGPEVGTTYTVRIYNGVTLLRTTAGITGATWTYDAAMQTADAAPGTITVKLKSVRDGLDSLREYTWTFIRYAIGVLTGTSAAVSGTTGVLGVAISPITGTTDAVSGTTGTLTSAFAAMTGTTDAVSGTTGSMVGLLAPTTYYPRGSGGSVNTLQTATVADITRYVGAVFDNGQPGNTRVGQLGTGNASPPGTIVEIADTGATLLPGGATYPFTLTPGVLRLPAGSSIDIQLYIGLWSGSAQTFRIYTRIMRKVGSVYTNAFTTNIVGELSHSAGQEGWKASQEFTYGTAGLNYNHTLTIDTELVFGASDVLYFEAGLGGATTATDRNYSWNLGTSSKIILPWASV